MSRPKSKGLRVYGHLGPPPELYAHLAIVDLLMEDADVPAGEFSSWAAKEVQSLSIMGQLLLLAIFTRAKAVAIPELQVLSLFILAQTISKENSG